MYKVAYACLLAGGFTVVLGGCAAKQARGPHDFNIGVQKPEVLITINKAGTTLSAQVTAAHPCKSGAEKCIRVLKDNIAEIGFELKGPPGWHFTELTMYPVTTSEDKEECIDGDGNTQENCFLEQKLRAEFDAYDPSDANGNSVGPGLDGVIDLTAVSCNQLSKFALWNNNLWQQNYFYTVKVCNVDEEVGCLELDPPLENDGKGIQ